MHYRSKWKKSNYKTSRRKQILYDLSLINVLLNSILKARSIKKDKLYSLKLITFVFQDT